jgi:hypothetical protein
MSHYENVTSIMQVDFHEYCLGLNNFCYIYLNIQDIKMVSFKATDLYYVIYL